MDKKLAHLEYVPAPEKPEWFEKELREIVGVCPNGTDTYIRFVWGMDRMEQFGDETVPRYPDPDAKYVGLPFWVLEGWQSPDVYDRREWDAQKDILGEFPINGVWDFIEVYRTANYVMMPLGRSALKKAREWRFWKSKPKQRFVRELLAERKKIADLKDSRWEAKKSEIMNQFIEDFDRIDRLGARAPEFSIPKSNPVGGFKEAESGLLVPNN